MKRSLTVVVQYGSVVAVVSDTPDAFEDIEVLSVNYDCDESDDSALIPVVQGDGKTERALVGRWEVRRQVILIPGEHADRHAGAT